MIVVGSADRWLCTAARIADGLMLELSRSQAVGTRKARAVKGYQVVGVILRVRSTMYMYNALTVL